MSPASILFRKEQRPPELWIMIWKALATEIDNDFQEYDSRTRLNESGPPFYTRVHRHLREDPRRRQAKLVFAAAYSTALQEYGPELYEHVVLTSCGAVDAMLDCAMNSTLRPILASPARALWVKHIDLILSDQEGTKIDWVGTRQAWAGFHHLETLTICYYPKEPAPLNPYCPIAAHLPPSLKLLRLRPWGEADNIPQKFPQILKAGKNGRIAGLRQDFWYGNTWAAQIAAFQNVPNIHLQAVVYVVWPPFSQRAAEEAFRPWTGQVDGGSLHNISVTLFLPNEGLDIEDAVRELDGDGLTLGKRYGYFPPNASDEDNLPDILCYDWRIGADGRWEVDMTGRTAYHWVLHYGHFSYTVGHKLDYRQEWTW